MMTRQSLKEAVFELWEKYFQFRNSRSLTDEIGELRKQCESDEEWNKIFQELYMENLDFFIEQTASALFDDNDLLQMPREQVVAWMKQDTLERLNNAGIAHPPINAGNLQPQLVLHEIKHII